MLESAWNNKLRHACEAALIKKLASSILPPDACVGLQQHLEESQASKRRRAAFCLSRATTCCCSTTLASGGMPLVSFFIRATARACLSLCPTLTRASGTCG